MTRHAKGQSLRVNRTRSTPFPMRAAASGLLSAVPLLLALAGPAFADAGTATTWAEIRGSDAEVRAWDADLHPSETVDSARVEFERGRYLRAVQLLREALDLPTADPDEILLLAKAEAGRRNWEGVRALLSDREWLPELEGGTGLYLLGRAYEAEEEWAVAAPYFEQRVRRLHELRVQASLGDGSPSLPMVGPTALPSRGALTGPLPLDPLESAAWRALAAGRAEAPTSELGAALADLEATSPAVASFVALELGRKAARRGEVAAVRFLVPWITDPEATIAAWDLEERALLASGDTAAALAGYLRLAEGDTRPAAWASAGELELLSGNAEAAAEHFRHTLELVQSGGPAIRSALGLVGIGGTDGELSFLLARVLRRGGETRAAVRAYDRAIEGLGGVEALGQEERLARAVLLGSVGRVDDAVPEFRALSQPDVDAALGARALASWASMRRSQGRREDVRTLESRLVTRFPNTPEAASVHFFRGDASHDVGALDAAKDGYGKTLESARSSDRGGLAAMRLAQLHLREGDVASALGVWTEYLEFFPNGRRWGEAQYWAATAELQLGDTASWNARLDAIAEREPFSYYAVLAAEDRGRRFAPSLPTGPLPGTLPEPMVSDLVDVLVLDRVGLGREAEWLLSALEDRAQASTEHRRLLAEALVAHGRPLDGINLGWSLLGDGEPWSMRMVRIVYPFPFAEMVRQEAVEKGLDGSLLAGLIRQESAFVPSIVSAAGARGLTQVMPATGRDLARSTGISGYTDESLFSGETNLLLGTHYLVEMDARFDGDLELILSAYNAGPHRADVWRQFEEASDTRRFIERIPYTETRGYVKNVLRNQAIYEWLWSRPATSP